MSLEKNDPQQQTTSFQYNNYLKASAVSMLTLGAYALARATNFLPQWRTQSGATLTEVSEKPELGHMQLQNAEASVVQSNLDTTSSKSAERLSIVAGEIHTNGLAEFKEIELKLPQAASVETQKPETTHQRKLLSQTTVLKPILDQVINANELYDFSIDVNEIFGPGMKALAIMGMPTWMNPNYYPLLQNYRLPEAVNAITIAGTKAYVADGKSGLYILDISNPSTTVLLGHYDTPGTAYNVAVSRDTACVADGDSLQILNVSNPENPTYSSSYSKLGAVRDVVLDGNLAYVVDDGLLQLLNVTDILSPAAIGNGFIVGISNCLTINTSIAYLATSMGVYTYEYLPPRLFTPMLLGQYTTVENAYDITVVGSTAYVVEGNGLQIIDVANPATPILLSNYTFPSGAYDITVVGTTAYVAAYGAGLQIINVANPAAPILLGQYLTLGDANSVTVVGTTAYVAEWGSGFNGLQIINVTNPVAPTLLGQYATTGAASNIAVVGTTVYVAEQFSFNGLQIINVANPATPILLGQYATLQYATCVTVVGTMAYVVEDDNGFKIINVANPAAPTLLSQYTTSGYVVGIAVVGTTAYVTESSTSRFNGLKIMNVANPATPILLDQYATPGYPQNVAVVGATAYVVEGYGGFNGLQIIRIENLINSAGYQTANPVLGINIFNNTAVVALGNAGIQSLSLANATSPTEVSSTVSTAGAAQSITQVGVAAYISEGTNGFQVFNMANPSQPSLIGTCATASSVTSMVMVGGNIAYVAGSATGIQILDLAHIHLQGIPALFNVGDVYTFTVTATDELGNWATTSFKVTVARFPVVFQSIAPPNAFWANKPISFTLPHDTFVDPNNEPLSYSAVLTNQSPLPAWLTFSSASNLTFSGTTLNVASLTTFTIQVTAVNPLGGHVSATFPLVIQPNVPPTLANLISTQSASVGVAFKFVIPQGTFIDPEGDALTYRATLSDGSPLPTWLSFDGNTFSGVSGRGDTDFYSTRVLPIFLTATDGKFSTSTTFNINVGGVSGGELFVKIASPLLSAAGFALAAYKKRALCLNRINKKKYQRLEGDLTLVVGEAYSHKLNTPAKDIALVQAKLLKPACCCPRFFKSTNKVPIPGGNSLPKWLSYDENANSLVSDKGPPSADWGSLIIQVKNKAGVIKEEFTLKLADSVSALDTQPAVGADDVPLEVLPKGPGKV